MIVSMVLSVFMLVPAIPVDAQQAADVTAVDGLAYNFYTDVSLFGGPSARRGYRQDSTATSSASPSVTCPEGGGSATEVDPDDVWDTDAAPGDGSRAVYGPAVIFGGIWPEESPSAPPSGPLTSSIDCQLGETGQVTASTSVTLMPPGTVWDPPEPGGPTYPHPGGVGPGPFVADEVHSSCTMTPDGLTSDVTIVNGILETRYDPQTQEPVESEPVPENPEPNYTREGTIDHVGDSYRIVFNEQTENADGSVTINAAHMYLLGPTAVGDMVIGSVTCGPLTVEDAPPATGQIAGTVTDASSGQAIAGATITVDTTTATTGADGTYQIDGLDPGDHTITADADGYQQASQTATVNAGETTTVDFALQADAAEPGEADPQTKEDCKKGGWQQYGFRNQGQCIRFVNTGKDSRP